LGIYPWRERQKESGQDPHATIFRYRGDIAKDSDRFRINWDRYLGHNIACVAVDGNGEVIDFDFNHNNVFRSSAEHAEARMVRRLFSLAQIFDKWRTGTLIPGKSRGFSLQDVTIYTSLESCAQCSGVMSLGRVRQVVYLQHDPGAYRVGNIMFNLAGRDPGDNASALAPIPVDASVLGVRQVGELDLRYLEFRGKISTAGRQKDKKLAYFIPPDGSDPDYAPSITSFLCTDNAYAVFDRGADEFTRLTLQYPTERGPHSPSGWTNQECLAEARRFFQYADVEGFRGTPHKL